MTRLGRYCKAFTLRELRRWDQWPPNTPAGQTEASILYLQDDYSVTRGVLADKDSVYRGVSQEWREFCRDELNFRVPDCCLSEAGEESADPAR